jgi:hypothetical protein
MVGKGGGLTLGKVKRNVRGRVKIEESEKGRVFFHLCPSDLKVRVNVWERGLIM